MLKTAEDGKEDLDQELAELEDKLGKANMELEDLLAVQEEAAGIYVRRRYLLQQSAVWELGDLAENDLKEKTILRFNQPGKGGKHGVEPSADCQAENIGHTS